MRILLVGLNFSPEFISTGKYTTEMAQHLAAAGHTVRVITTPPYYPEWRVWPGYRWWAYRRETLGSIEISRAPLWVPRRVNGLSRLLHYGSFALSSIPPLVRTLPWRPDWVLVVAPSLFSAPIPRLLARLTSGRTWLHIQDFEVEAAFRLGMLPGQRLLQPLAEAWERGLLSRFDRVSTISKRMLAHLHTKGVDSERAVLLPNWVDVKTIKPLSGPSPLRAELGIAPETRVILYSGNMGRKQGLEIVVQAAHLCRDEPDMLFVLCGDGVARAELESQSAGLASMRFLPLQPVERLNDLLNLADVHILPQRAGAADLVMPSKLTGMLASGKAVVATAAPGTELAEVIGQVGYLTPPEDPQKLAEALRGLAQDPAERQRLGALGRAYAETHLARQQVLDQLLTQLEHGQP